MSSIPGNVGEGAGEERCWGGSWACREGFVERSLKSFLFSLRERGATFAVKKKKKDRGLLSGWSVVKTSHFHCQEPEFNPCSG